MERLFNHQTIDEFLLDITETTEYKSIKYLIFSIRMNYLHYMAISRIVKFEIPKYLENLIDQGLAQSICFNTCWIMTLIIGYIIMLIHS